MKLDDYPVGTTLAHPDSFGDVGEVVGHDHDDNMLLIKWPLGNGKFDIDSMDPDEDFTIIKKGGTE